MKPKDIMKMLLMDGYASRHWFAILGSSNQGKYVQFAKLIQQCEITNVFDDVFRIKRNIHSELKTNSVFLAIQKVSEDMS